MHDIADKNRQSWDAGADRYASFVHSEPFLQRIFQNPANAFHPAVWKLLQRFVPGLRGARICVPSSGDNHAVFAFAMLGASVTSCDISKNQLANAEKVARRYDWGRAITFVCADTMQLQGVPDDAFDLVYTSNGVHVWIDDLSAMYASIRRVLAPGGVSVMYDIHPFNRPFDDDLHVVKPYDRTGPHETEDEVTFAWRVMDLMNAMLESGLTIRHVEEMFAEKDYAWPFWLSLQELEDGVTATPEEVDRRYDWHNTPSMALPSWLSVVATKDA